MNLFDYNWWLWKIFFARLRKQDAINRAFDEKYSTETALEIPLVAAGVAAEDASRGNGVYRPFWESDFRKVMSQLPVLDGRYTFVDIGSGKGKLLFLASNYPFKKIIGIEYAPKLHEAAVKNLAIYNSPNMKCRDIELILGDAIHYSLPPGPVACIFFNACDPPTTRKILLNLDENAKRADPVYIAYANLRSVSEMPADVFAGYSNLSVKYRSGKYVVLSNVAPN